MHGECGGYLRFGHHLQSTQHSLLPIFSSSFFVWINVFFLLRGRITEEVNFEGIFHRKNLLSKDFLRTTFSQSNNPRIGVSKSSQELFFFKSAPLSIDRVNVECWKQSQSWKESGRTARGGLVWWPLLLLILKSTKKYQKYKLKGIVKDCQRGSDYLFHPHPPSLSSLDPGWSLERGWGVWRAIIYPTQNRIGYIETRRRRKGNK